MRRLFGISLAVTACVALYAFETLAGSLPGEASSLRGKIITSNREISVPSTAKTFVPRLVKQDRKFIRKNQDGQWVIHFVAFFNRPSPKDSAGVVVLDAKGEPVQVASLKLQKGQTNLASQIVVEGTETPRQPHTLQIYFARNNKPVVLAKKNVVLK